MFDGTAEKIDDQCNRVLENVKSSYAQTVQCTPS